MKNSFIKKGAAVVIAAALIVGSAPTGAVSAVSELVSITASAAEITGIETWAQLQEAIDSAEEGDVLKLADSVYAGEEDAALHVPQGKKITIFIPEYRYLSRNLDEAKDDGYVILNEGDLTLMSEGYALGEISGGKNTGNGGGIVNKGKLTVKNVEINYNRAKNGGGIYNEGELIFDSYDDDPEDESRGRGAWVSSNYANEKGGAVYNAEGGTVKLNDTAYINSNYSKDENNNDVNGNIYLSDGTYIDVTGSFGTEEDLSSYSYAFIGISVDQYEGRVFTRGFSQHNPTLDAARVFASDSQSWDVIAAQNGEGTFDLNRWGDLKQQIADIADSDDKTGTIVLDADVISDGEDLCYIEIPYGTDITIDLNGHKIDKCMPDDYYGEDGYVFKVEGTLTVKDSSGTNAGIITGGDTYDFAYGSPGCVLVTGTFNFEGGTITGNKGTKSAVCVEGQMHMSGGVISGNINNTDYSSYYSGGVTACKGLYISGAAVIKDNYNVKRNYNFDIDDYEEIRTPSDLGFLDDGYVNIEGALTEGNKKADIHVVSKTGVITNGYPQNADAEDFFTPDDDNYKIVKAETGELLIRKAASYIKEVGLSVNDAMNLKFVTELGENDSVVIKFEWGKDDDGGPKTFETTVYGSYGYNPTFTLPIAAKEIFDNIHYSVRTNQYSYDYDEYGEPIDTSVEIESGYYNVKTQYLDTIVNTGADSTVQLVKALENYCAKACVMFDYNADAINSVPEYTPSEGISIDDIRFFNGIQEPEDYVNDDLDISYYGTSLLLKDKFVLRNYFKVNKKPEYLFFKYTDLNSQNHGNGYLSAVEDAEGYYYFDIPGITPDALDRDYTINIGYTNDGKWHPSYDTNIIKAMTYQYSAGNYVYLAYTKGDDNTKAAAEAIYYFYREAKLYNED